MTKQQLSQAVELAESEEVLSGEDIGHFDGFGLGGFQPVTCTIRQLARLVRWQCVRLDLTVDADALNEIATLGKRRFMVV
jgi:hypothetical protein